MLDLFYYQNRLNFCICCATKHLLFCSI
uniref:Uncharacterized protein n=1 Tax=Rhizophora mucronata TaxID=61149 RepID=A0A2P2PD24_RHIMU